MNPQKLYRLFLKLILLMSIVIAIVITYISYKQNEWATMASAMTVVTAVLAIGSSLNLTWHQEDEKQPQINLYIDHSSHKHAYSLVIKNEGGSPAYKVKIDWTIPLYDYDHRIPRFTDFDDDYDFHYLQTGVPYSRFIIGSDNIRKLFDESDKPLVYEGLVSYSTSSKGIFRVKQTFKISLEPFKKRLNVLNDQMDFYFENKKISTHLNEINVTLQKLNKTLDDDGKKPN